MRCSERPTATAVVRVTTTCPISEGDRSSPPGGPAGLSVGDTAGALTSSHSHGAGTLAVESHTHGSGSLAVASHTHGPGTYEASHTHALEGTALLGAGLLGGSISTEDAAVTGTSGSASPGLSGSTASASPGLSGSSAADAPSILHPVMGIHLVMVVAD